MLADLAGHLRATDVVFFVTHGLTDETREVQISPARDGDLSWFDCVSDRFSRFNRQQIKAIILFLEYKKVEVATGYERFD